MISLNAAVATEHRADLLREAAQRRARTSDIRPLGKPGRTATIAIRPAAEDEARVVMRLAQLDDAPGLKGPVLLALVDGEAVAALSLLDHRVVANPFALTQEAVALLRVRATHLLGRPKRRRSRSILRPRFA